MLTVPVPSRSNASKMERSSNSQREEPVSSDFAFQYLYFSTRKSSKLSASKASKPVSSIFACSPCVLHRKNDLVEAVGGVGLREVPLRNDAVEELAACKRTSKMHITSRFS